MPYAAKATVEHQWVTDHVELYLTFEHPMLRTRDPLASPPVYDVMPPLSKWLLDCNAVDTDITESVWIDEYTLKLTSDTLTAAPSVVALEYDGPDDDLCLKWDKQVYPWGPIPSTELPAVDPTPIALRYPTHATLWHDEVAIISGSPLFLWVDAYNAYNLSVFQEPCSDGDTFSISLFLKAGTYTLNFLGWTGTNRGKIDWYLDNVKIITGQDWYAADAAVNTIFSTSNIVITTNGLHTIRGIVNGKNPASTDYYINLTKYWFTLQ